MYRNLVLFAKNSWISDIQPHRISGIRLFKLVGYLAGQIACKSVTGDPLPILQSKIKLKSTKKFIRYRYTILCVAQTWYEKFLQFGSENLGESNVTNPQYMDPSTWLQVCSTFLRIRIQKILNCINLTSVVDPDPHGSSKI